MIKKKMHHHHLPPPIMISKRNLSRDGTIAVTTPPVNHNSIINNAPVVSQQQQRRRKKRPNYGNRTVEVCRGFNGFGFTISGQQPCRLSCIVSNSPADQAGLRAGDFLISVNGLNVSKLPHDSVVQLIGNSFGSIRMQIAENYYSDSSDEENTNIIRQHYLHLTPPVFQSVMTGGAARCKPRYLHQKAKLNRSRNSRSRISNTTVALREKQLFEQTLYKQSQQLKRQQLSNNCMRQKQQQRSQQQQITTPVGATITTITQLRPLIEHLPLRTEIGLCAENQSTSSNINTTSNVANVSAMVCIPNNTLEYRVIVGYLGTIEMPKQISQSSKLQTVRSCIRKLRQEKRQPTTTLMIILPDCLRLCSANGTILATYASSRLNYVSSASETENRFFGLVTSSIYTIPIEDVSDHNIRNDHNNDDQNQNCVDDNDDDNVDNIQLSSNTTEHITISNSCHVFAVDTKLCEHRVHSSKAQQFHIECTKDPIYPDVCLEFPSNSEYVVNLIRSMYTMRILPPATSATTVTQQLQLSSVMVGGGFEGVAHSPQPSNHSEISTTTSNSDSGIGFHNDFRNISDRIVLVNFPQEHTTKTTAVAPSLPTATTPIRHHYHGDDDVLTVRRPLGIFQRLNFNRRTKSPSTLMMNGVECNRLSVRARSDSITASNSNRKCHFINNFLTTSRSCGDVLNLIQNEDNCNNHKEEQPQKQQVEPCASSMDNISLYTASIENDEQRLFLQPTCLIHRQKQQQSVLLHDLLNTKISPSMRSPSPLSSAPTVLDKLSPQVYMSNFCPRLYKNSKKISVDSKSTCSNYINLNSALKFNSDPIQLTSQDNVINIGGWTSLQNIPEKMFANDKKVIDFNQAISENNLVDAITTKNANGNDSNDDCTDDAFASPARRTWWSQISLRTPRSDKRTLYIHNNKNKNSNSTNTICLRGSNRQILQRSLSMGVESFNESILEGKHTNQQSTTIDNTAVSIASNTHKQCNKGVNDWAVSFERLLYDEEGLKTFAEFLKLEYSAENIYFWTACERYKHLEKDSERKIKSQEIYNRHLSSTALEPVNIDAEARVTTEEKLKYSTSHADLFEAAQKQIFNLMKYDSYQRFLRSDLYKKCQHAAENNEALPFSKKSLDHMLRIKFQIDYAMENLDGNYSFHEKHNDEDRRRKSLLPWHRKMRRKSGITHNKSSEMLKGVGSNSGSTIISSLNRKILIVKHKQKQQQNSDVMVDIHGSRSSLSSYDSTINCNGIISNVLDSKISSSLCRVKLPNESTTIAQIQCHETVKELIDRVLEKRGLHYQHYEVFVKGLPTSRSINLQRSSQEVIGKDLEIEYRVTFKLDLIDLAKVISVKSKPHKQLHQVIKPILQKYHYKIDEVELVFSKTQEIINLQQPVLVVDGERLQVKLKGEKFNIRQQSGDNHDQNQNQNNKIERKKHQLQESILNEIKNKVFQHDINDKFGRTETNCSTENKNEMTAAVTPPFYSLKSEEHDYESDSSATLQRVFKKLRDSSNVLHLRINHYSNKVSDVKDNAVATTTTTAAILLEQSTTISHPNRHLSQNQYNETHVENSLNNSSINVNENHDDLLEDLKRAQLARLEDQRGTEINIELPDFLKNQENVSNNSSNLITHDALEKPQPAPRLSITQRDRNLFNQVLSLTTITTTTTTALNTVGISPTKSCTALTSKSPPPLPPKPKILPIKPSNWGVPNTAINNDLNRKIPSTALAAWPLSGQFLKKISQTDNNSINHNNNATIRGAYLEETSSSFV